MRLYKFDFTKIKDIMQSSLKVSPDATEGYATLERRETDFVFCVYTPCILDETLKITDIMRVKAESSKITDMLYSKKEDSYPTVEEISSILFENLSHSGYMLSSDAHSGPAEHYVPVSLIADSEMDEDFQTKVDSLHMVLFEEYHSNDNVDEISVIHYDNQAGIEEKVLLDAFNFCPYRDKKIFTDFTADYLRFTNSHRRENFEDIMGYLITDSFREYIKKTFSKCVFLSVCAHRFLVPYVSNFEKLFNEKRYFFSVEEDTLKIKKVSIYGEFKNNKITIKTMEEYHFEAGQNKTSCLKKLKRGERKSDLFEMFNINSGNWDGRTFDIVYENAENEIEFIKNNMEFFEKMKFMDVIYHTDRHINMRNYIIFYFYMLAEFPSVELLMKTGHVTLLEDIYYQVSQCSSRQMMRGYVAELNGLIDNHATTSKKSLRFPNYISIYLSEKHAPLEEYLFWRDVYEISHLSKENFEKIINSIDFLYFKATIGDMNVLRLQEILKYGYKISKTISYIIKKGTCKQKETMGKYHFTNTDSQSYKEVAQILRDTLYMAETLGISIPKYPEHLDQLHDQLSESYREVIKEEESKVVKDMAIQCEGFLQESIKTSGGNIPKALEKYEVVFPKTSKEFIEEGANQHNCVAGYMWKVKKKKCIIFFIRKKDAPTESYITAEIIIENTHTIKKLALGQVMYSNNRFVPQEYDEYKLCRFVLKAVSPIIEEKAKKR